VTAEKNAGISPPRLSIVVATFNCATRLQACIDSIVAQTSSDWELLVVDGGSTDGTVDVIQSNLEHVAYWHSRPDAGIYDAWNQALECATGEYVCFLGADDAWHAPDVLASVFAAIGDRQYELVTGRGLLVDGAGRAIEEFGRPWDYRRVMKRMTICHPGALHRRELFRRFGAFDTGYRICADYEFLLRLPASLRSLHLDMTMVDVADGGVSRIRRMSMLKERFRAQVRSSRVGPVRASLYYLDKLWRIPVARVLGIRN
jgi:glycosyltransferase involved in cell wall biosynthesis